MKVILTQDVAKIGKKFEIKSVSDGYAINFLFPQKLAKLATDQALSEIEIAKKKYQAEKEVALKEVKKVLEKLKEPIEIKAKTNETGKLFAGIDKEGIVTAIQDKTGMKINPEIIELKKPIKEVGEHNVKIGMGKEEGSINLIIIGEEK
jgi:large subunit ribosomal protein L9